MQFPKQERIRDEKYKDHVRSLPCTVTNKTPVEAAHIRFGSKSGVGIKPCDSLILALHPDEHHRQHLRGEVTYWLEAFQSNPALMMDCVRAYAEKMYREWKVGK
jgi:hypothetical protein